MNTKYKDFVKLGRKILGAGLNYKSLVKERNVPMPQKPIMFLKPVSSYIQEGQIIEVPKNFDVYEEVELGVIIGKRCKNISVSDAMNYVAGYCLALDLTAVDDMLEILIKQISSFGRKKSSIPQVISSDNIMELLAHEKLQCPDRYTYPGTWGERWLILIADNTATGHKEARQKGLPWTFGKGFDTACPVSKFIPYEVVPDPSSLFISCAVNGKTAQESKLSDMIFSIEELIAYTAQYMTLEPCDLILTGSPSGNCPIRAGDTIEAKLDNILCMKFPVKST